MKSILIIGAGPAGLYAAEKLSDEGHQITLVNRDIKPGGLAEFGIYLNKYKMKETLRSYFKNLLERDSIHYFGHVSVGESEKIHFDDLEKLGFDAIVVAVGAQGTKSLGLEGEEFGYVYHAKDLVYHYNGLPPFSEHDYPVGDHVCVVGIGNVSLDIVHWLACEKKVATVTTVARRGPGEVKFTKKEVRVVSGAMDQEQIHEEIQKVSERVEAVGQKPAELEKMLLKFVDYPLETESPTKFKMRFLLSPFKIEHDTDGAVTGLTCRENRLVQKGDRIGVEPTGNEETIPCDCVVFAIGDQIDADFGLPLNPEWKGEYATVKESWDENPDRPRYMVYDPVAGQAKWGVFVVGWARNASDGLVGKARLDATTGCDEVLAYLNGQFQGQPTHEEEQGHEGEQDAEQRLVQLLTQLNVEWVSWEEAKILEDYEEGVAKEKGLGVYRVGNNEEMLKICKKKS